MPGITASRNYYPGDLIYSEESFVQVLPRKLKDIACESCNGRSFDLKACKQCLAVKYCGKACQKKDWSSHRLECLKLKNLPEGVNVDIVHLLGKIILKIKGRDWKTVKKQVLGTDISFDDIDSHYREMTENRRLNLRCQELNGLTERFIGKENMPSDVDFIKILGKLFFNWFSAGAISFFIGCCTFDGECIPNANVESCRRHVKICANKKIAKGVDKISIPTRQLLSFLPNILESDQIRCSCTDCSLPYGNSVLTKILDEKRAYSVIRESEALLNGISMLPSEFNVGVRLAIDEVLEKQKGVLGNTNLLRMRLLAYKCFQFSGHPLGQLANLLELEKYMSSAFGEFYSEMLEIYETLGLLLLHTGNPTAASRYMLKAQTIQMHQFNV